MIKGEICYYDGYGVLVFSKFLISNSIYLKLEDFCSTLFYKPKNQYIVPYITFDMSKNLNYDLEVIFKNRPSISFAHPVDIEKWILHGCNLHSTIEISLSTLEYQLSNYIKNISVIENYYSAVLYKRDIKVISLRDLYYFRKWISTLELKIDAVIEYYDKKLGWI